MNNRMIRLTAGLVVAAVILGVALNAFGPTVPGI